MLFFLDMALPKRSYIGSKSSASTLSWIFIPWWTIHYRIWKHCILSHFHYPVSCYSPSPCWRAIWTDSQCISSSFLAAGTFETHLPCLVQKDEMSQLCVESTPSAIYLADLFVFTVWPVPKPFSRGFLHCVPMAPGSLCDWLLGLVVVGSLLPCNGP